MLGNIMKSETAKSLVQTSNPWPHQREPSKLDIRLCTDFWRCVTVFRAKLKFLSGMISHIDTACSGSSQRDIAYELECPLFLLYWDSRNLNFSIKVQCVPQSVESGSLWVPNTLYYLCWFTGPSCPLDCMLCRSRNEVKYFPPHLTLVLEKAPAHDKV